MCNFEEHPVLTELSVLLNMNLSSCLICLEILKIQTFSGVESASMIVKYSYVVPQLSFFRFLLNLVDDHNCDP